MFRKERRNEIVKKEEYDRGMVERSGKEDWGRVKGRKWSDIKRFGAGKSWTKRSERRGAGKAKGEGGAQWNDDCTTRRQGERSAYAKHARQNAAQ